MSTFSLEMLHCGAIFKNHEEEFNTKVDMVCEMEHWA